MVSDEFGFLCNSKFCLCICKELDCSGEYMACIPTKIFVLLRNSQKLETRIIKLDSPFNLVIKRSIESAVPFSDSINLKIDDPIIGRKQLIQTVSPLFFKFNDNEWFWSPDLEIWMSMSENKVSSGKWNGINPSPENLRFIDEMRLVNQRPDGEAEGLSAFNNLGAKMSNKFLILER
jgi:hypothetical protein